MPYFICEHQMRNARSQIGAFKLHCFERIIKIIQEISISEILRPVLVSEAEQIPVGSSLPRLIDYAMQINTI